MNSDPPLAGLISVVFENRPDGGLRVYCDDVPGFVLSHPDRNAVLGDVKPALETIISAMAGEKMEVVPSETSRSNPWLADREVREYRTLRAA